MVPLVLSLMPIDAIMYKTELIQTKKSHITTICSVMSRERASAPVTRLDLYCSVLRDDVPSICSTVSSNLGTQILSINLRRTPGIQPRMSRQMLMSKSAPHPTFRKTETNGRNSARKYRHISD